MAYCILRKSDLRFEFCEQGFLLQRASCSEGAVGLDRASLDLYCTRKETLQRRPILRTQSNYVPEPIPFPPPGTNR